jgi:hypothetical protein
LGVQEALSSHLAGDVGEHVDEGHLTNHVVSFLVHRIEKLEQVLYSDIELQALSASYEILFGQGTGGCSSKDSVELLESKATGVLGLGKMLAALSNQRIYEALVCERNVDLSPRHEVQEILEGALEASLIRLSHVCKDPGSLLLGDDDIELVEDKLHTININKLI